MIKKTTEVAFKHAGVTSTLHFVGERTTFCNTDRIHLFILNCKKVIIRLSYTNKG